MRCGRIDQRRQWRHGFGWAAPGPAALGAVLGLLSVTELAIRLTARSTVHAELAPGPPVHAGINLPTALLMGAFCLLATVPAGWLRPLPAALTVYVAARCRSSCSSW